MLSHIKDLFRQRKERQQRRFFSNTHFISRQQTKAMDTNNNAVLVEQPVAIPAQQQNHVNQKKRSKQMSTDTIVAQPAEKVNAADELANLLVEADNKRRSQLPQYPGLERFEMVRKLGEYVAILYIRCTLC